MAVLTGELRERMPLVTTLREQLALAFEAHQRLVSIHPFNGGNGRTSRLLMNYVQRYYDQPPDDCLPGRPAGLFCRSRTKPCRGRPRRLLRLYAQPAR